MKREILFYVFALTVVASITDRIYACCDKPVADFVVSPATWDPYAGYFACINQSLTFDGSSSYDPDNVDHSCAEVDSWDWVFGDGSTGTGETTTHTYNTIGEKTIELTVTDNDSTCCCPAVSTTCTDKDDDLSIPITIVKVDKVVKEGTTDDGPLVVCKNGTVDLEAKSDPSISLTQWPPGSPVWSVSGPEGTDPSLDPEYGSPTTTLSGLTKAGLYSVRAKCCSSCSATGDTITIKVIGAPIRVLDSCGDPYGKYLVLANPASSSPTEHYAAASGQSSGTTYKWTITSGSDKAHILGPDTGSTVALKADAEGDLTIQLTYTLVGVSCSATLDTAVQKPSQTYSYVTCGPRGGYCSPGWRGAHRDLYYHIRDGEDRPIPHARWDEWWHCSGFPPPSGCCWAGADADADCDGKVWDHLEVDEALNCDNWGLLCSDWQTIKVSGWPVSGHFWSNNLYYYDRNYNGIAPFIKLSPHCTD